MFAGIDQTAPCMELTLSPIALTVQASCESRFVNSHVPPRVMLCWCAFPSTCVPWHHRPGPSWHQFRGFLQLISFGICFSCCVCCSSGLLIHACGFGAAVQFVYLACFQPNSLALVAVGLVSVGGSVAPVALTSSGDIVYLSPLQLNLLAFGSSPIFMASAATTL